MRLVLESPAVPRSAKVRAITRIAELLSLSRTIRNFLCVLQRHRRLSELRNIVPEIEALWDERRGIVNAIVITPMRLNPEQEEALAQALSAKYSKPIKLTTRVEPRAHRRRETADRLDSL